MKKFKEFIDSLTIEQAMAWEATTEKWLYVDDDILGPNDFGCSDARVDAVENRFAQLIQENK